MSGRYTNGETMIRPGIYFRETSTGSFELSGAENGVVAVAFKSNWGPLGKVVTLETPNDISTTFGDDSGEGSNVAILEKLFMGGASLIKAVRVGTGGTVATTKLKDTTEESGKDVVELTAKCAGTRPLTVTIKDSLSAENTRECIIHTGTKELTKVTFAKGEGEPAALVEAINASLTSIVTAKKLDDGNGTLKEIAQEAFGTPGVSPEVSNQDYSAAFELLEAQTFNILTVDSNDNALHLLVKSFMDRANDGGLMAIAVVGEPTSVEYQTRKSHAVAFNSPNIVYVLNGFVIGDVPYEGFNAAAVVAGRIAALPSNDSPTHKIITGATELVGGLTNAQINECLQSGCLVFSMSATGNVWIDQGINTLVTLGTDQDAGWKKIRRQKTRYELIQRILRSSEGIIGTVSNDSNGRATFVAIANGIINEMIAENKLESGSVYEDPNHPATGESAWFIIAVQDLDSLEKVYITYRFSYSSEGAATAGSATGAGGAAAQG